RTMGLGEHFGELAARDWGGGYGYARTATVRCTQDGQLLRLSSDDFQWLVGTQPAVRAELAGILADRLRQRQSHPPLMKPRAAWLPPGRGRRQASSMRHGHAAREHVPVSPAWITA